MQDENTTLKNQVGKNMNITPQELTSWICPVDERVNPGNVEVCPLCGRRREKGYSNAEKQSQPTKVWICPVCNAVNGTDLLVCRICGASKPPIEPSPKPSPDRYTRKAWKCPVCYNQNRMELDVCEKCGTPYSWKCEYCQFLNKNKAIHCVNCGRPKKPPKNNKIVWIVAAIIMIIIIIAASSYGTQTNSTQNNSQVRVTPVSKAKNTIDDAFNKGVGMSKPLPTPTTLPSAIDVAWTDTEYLRENQHSATYYLTTPIENCTYLKMELTVTECSGFPYGNWYLYAKDLSDHWKHIDAFRIEKDVVMGKMYTYVFRFSEPQSFKALAISMQDRGNEYSISYSISFYTE